MNQLLKWTALTALALTTVSCWLRDDFPKSQLLVPQLRDEPLQTPTVRAPFDVVQGGITYEVHPEYGYELHGLVVSLQQHNPQRSLHERWQDHLNVADLCVVWGNNTNLNLNRYEFRNGQFTCFVNAEDQSAWQQFDPHGIANNHLLVADTALRERLRRVRVGDQIALRGVLASYAHDGGFRRGTSTTRTDSGNGACETIFVDEFQLIASMSTPWRAGFTVGWVTLTLVALLWLWLVMSGRLQHRARN